MNHTELDAAIEQANRIFSSRYTPRPDKSQEPERPAAPAEQRGWPPVSLDAERRFGRPHAKLFPFIGRKVRTPTGTGTLLQVFSDRATVLLDSELSRCSFFSPGQIEPVSWELQ
jgi:hypothetical protein